MAAAIDDVHSMKWMIPGIDGVFDAVDFTYRRMTPRRNTKLWDRFAELKPDDKFDRQRDVLIEHIVEWSLGIPIDKDAFETMEPMLFEAMIAEVGRLSARFKAKESPEKN